MSVRMVRLGDVVDIKGGGTPSKSNPDFWHGDIPWVSPKDMKFWEIRDAADKITTLAIKGSATNLIPVNSILLVNRSGILKHTLPVGITRRSVAINQDIKALICGPKAHPEYVAHLVKAAEPVVLKWVRATTADNFPIDNLRELEIPLPPLDEQRRIAAILEKAVLLRQKRRQAIALLDEAVEASFWDGYNRSTQTAANIRFSDLAKNGSGNFGNGPFGSDLLTSELQDSGVPVIYIRDIRDGEYSRVSSSFVTEAKAKTLASAAVHPGDVLIAKVGDPPGIAAIYPEGEPHGIVTQDVIRIRANEANCLKEYLRSFLNSTLGKHVIQGITVAATRARFSLRDLKNLEIPLPPVVEQAMFVEQVTGLERERKRMQAMLKETDALFASLQHRAFSGEL